MKTAPKNKKNMRHCAIPDRTPCGTRKTSPLALTVSDVCLKLSVLSVGSRRSSFSEFQAIRPATAKMSDAHTSWDCVETQRGNDAWPNDDVVDWPHQRFECSSPSSTGEPCDEGSYDIHLVSEGHRLRLRSSTDRSCAVPRTVAHTQHIRRHEIRCRRAMCLEQSSGPLARRSRTLHATVSGVNSKRFVLMLLPRSAMRLLLIALYKYSYLLTYLRSIDTSLNFTISRE